MSSGPLPSPDRAASPALTALPVPLVLTESDGRIVEWNDAARSLLTRDAREIRFLSEAVDEASRPRIAAAAQQSVSGGSSEGVSVRLAHGSTEARHVLLSATHWPGRGVLWTALDHESESRRDARLAAIVESAPPVVSGA